MGAPILIELSPEAKATMASFEQAPYKIPFAIARGMDKSLPIVAGNIQANRLTGIGPFPIEEHKLGEVTTHLRASVRWTEAKIEGETVTGSIGSNVRYAAVHEFGFEGDVEVKPFFRKNRKFAFVAKIERVSKKTGRSYKTAVRGPEGQSQVKQHTRHMRIPARAPFGYGIEDNTQLITDAMSAELLDTFRNL